MNLIIYFFFLVNFLSFLLMAYDKHLAKTQKRRISERTLLGCVLLGGCIGSGLAMLTFRHKTAKKSFLFKFWTIIVLQLLAIIWFYFNNRK